MSRIKRWNGSKWTDYLPKRWSGSRWDNATVKRWNGSKWEIISEEQYVTTWNATWTASYFGEGNMDITTRVAKWGDTVSHYALWFKRTWNEIVNWNNLKSPHRIWEGVTYIVDKKPYGKRRNTSGWMYQGRYTPAKFEGDRGRQRSMVGFNHADMRSKLNGARIEKVEIYLKNKHFWYSSGKAMIGYHNSTSMPADFQQSRYAVKSENFTQGQGRWITMSNEYGEWLRDGKAKGFTLFSNSNDLNYYGYFHGKGAGSEPKIRITYKK